MNPPVKSKINWTAFVIQIIGIGAVLNWFPPEIEQNLTEIALILGPTLIQIFRTWYTEKRP